MSTTTLVTPRRSTLWWLYPPYGDTLPSVHSDDPFSVHPYVRALRRRVQRGRDIMAGEEALRYGDTYLPMFPKEEDQEWEFRKKNTFLDNIYADTIQTHAARIFTQPTKLRKDVPAQLLDWQANVDGHSNDLASFGRQFFELASSDGIGWIVTTRVSEDEVDGATSEAALDAPWWIHVDAYSALGWRFDRGRLRQFRYLDYETEEDGSYGERFFEVAYVLEPGRWEKHRREAGSTGPGDVTQGRFATPDFMPVSPCITGHEDAPWLVRSVYEPIAAKQIEHFQVDSEVKNQLHWALRTIIHFQHFTSGEFETLKDIVNGLGIRSDPRDANKHPAEVKPVTIPVEPQQVGRAKLAEIKGAMLELAKKAEEGEAASRPVGRNIASERNATLKSRAMRLQQCLDVALGHVAGFYRAEIPANPVILQVDTLGGMTKGDEQTLLAMNGQKGGRKIIADQTTIEEMKRRDTLHESVTWETEQEKILAEMKIAKERAEMFGPPTDRADEGDQSEDGEPGESEDDSDESRDDDAEAAERSGGEDDE